MSIITFLDRIAGMKTGEELDGHMSGADAVGTLSYLIVEARALRASASAPDLTADGLTVLRTLRDLVDEALLTHIYQDESEIPADCGYLIARDEADAILDLHSSG
jgi:hypothetical protein